MFLFLKWNLHIWRVVEEFILPSFLPLLHPAFSFSFLIFLRLLLFLFTFSLLSFLFFLHSLPPSFHLFFISFLRFLYFLLSFFSFTFFPPLLTAAASELRAECAAAVTGHKLCRQFTYVTCSCSQTVTLKFICVQLPLPACSRPLSRTRFHSYNRKRPSRYLWPAGRRERENNICRATFPSRPLFPVIKPAAHTADTIGSRKFDLGWFHSALRILVTAWVSITSESVFISVSLDMRLVMMRRRTPRQSMCFVFISLYDTGL